MKGADIWTAGLGDIGNGSRRSAPCSGIMVAKWAEAASSAGRRIGSAQQASNSRADLTLTKNLNEGAWVRVRRCFAGRALACELNARLRGFSIVQPLIGLSSVSACPSDGPCDGD